jgi:tetratricopeptide (TPR) repeat protein
VDLISLFSDLAQQIFVKVLPDGSIVLHDKVAEWVFGLFEKDEAIKVYHALTEIYEEEILEQAHEIDRLLPFADPFMEVEEIDERKGNITYSVLQDPDAYKYANELRQTRRKRRNLIIEQMTYALRSNPLKGYKIYYERAEEAFNVGRMDYEMQIRTEFLQWWMGEDSYTHRLQAAQANVTKETIEADFAVRSVQRTYSATLSPSQRSQATIALINQILNRVSDKSDEFIIPTLAQSWLNLYGAMAHGQLVEKDDDIESIRQSFRSQIADLNGLLPGQSKQDLEDLDTFLIISALAFAYYELGYFESNHGNHGDAIESFNRSLPLYRKLGFEINLARSLNDKAYSLAVVGDAQRAETSINEALKLRKQLGFSFPIGLSYNTLAIVHTLGERPASALQYAKYALAVFRSLSHEFGQMLAYRASSEALRREAERIGVANRKLQQNRLLEALAASEAATTRSDHLLTDKDALLVDIYIEYGSVWRDLARFYWQNPDLYDVSSDNPAKKSYDWLQKGIVLARMIPGARSHLIDAIVNLAYLNYYEIANNASDKAHVLDTAEQVVAAAIREIPEVYSKPASKHEQSKKLSVYWSLLGKAHGLLVTISRQRLQLKGDVVCMEDAIVSEARKLLEEATLTLYFSSQLESNVRNVRRSNQIIYEAFQTFTDEALKCFSQHADSVSQSLQILARRQEDISIKRFLADNFGIDPIM